MQNQHFLLLSPSKKTELSPLNPQFVGIAKQLGKSHLNKNQAKNERAAISNRLSYLEKEENVAQKKLNKKQKQLEMLMSAITRRQADLQWKEAQRRAKEEAIAQQRQINMRRRNFNQQRIRESFLSMYDQNRQNKQKLRNTQRLHESMIKTMYKESLRSKQEKVVHSSLAKQEGRNKVANYYKQKNDLFTSRYKEKIRMEEQQAKKELQQAKKLQNISGQVKLRLQKSTSRIQEVSEEMKELVNKSKNLSVSRSLKWSELSQNNKFNETKTDSYKETDSKLDKLIQKELSFDEPELFKI